MRRYLPLLMSGVLLLCACASSPQTDDEATGAQTAAKQTEQLRAGDPFGVAQQWADAPADHAPEALTDRVSAWQTPIVLRLLRTTEGDYRAVVAETSGKDEPAVLLHIERKDGAWLVVDVEATTANHGWPKMR